MKSAEYWREHAARFRQLGRDYDRASDLHALRGSSARETAAIARRAAEAARRVPERKAAAVVYEAEATAAEAEPDQDHLPWDLVGGSVDHHEREALQRRFRALAIEGAVAADLVEAHSSEQMALDAWLGQL